MTLKQPKSRSKKTRFRVGIISRWQREQKERTKKHSSRKFSRWLFLLVFFFLFLVCLQFWHWNNESLWDGKNNFNFTLWTGDQFYIISYRAGLDEVNVVHVSGDTYVPLAHGFGEYPASSIWRMGELEKFGGGQLLQRSTQFFFGVPMQGWGKVDAKIKDQRSKLTKRELTWMLLKLGISSERNLSVWDIIRIISKVSSLSSADIHNYSLDKTRASEEIKLPDGSVAFKVQEEFLDGIVKDVFRDTTVLNEGIIWLIINQTDYQGLAADVARLINNISGEVAAYANRDEWRKRGIYCTKPLICQSYTAKLLSKSLNLTIQSETIDESRADAVIVLDDNYHREFYER